MNQIKTNDGGDLKITPSARKSIHAHKSYCPFALAETNMTRYGLGESSSKVRSSQVRTNDGEGRDEVDNVLSTLKGKRRLSVDDMRSFERLPRERHCQDNNEDSRESESELAKSLPTYLHSSTYFRERSFSSTPPRSSNSSHNLSQDSAGFSRVSYRESENVNYREAPKRTSGPNYSASILIISLAVLTFGIFLYSRPNGLLAINRILNSNILIRKELYDGLKFSADMEALGEEYDLNDDSLLQIQSGISTIHQKDITGSFIFVYDSKNKSFNKRMFLDVVNKIASLSAKYLRNESSSVQHLILEGGDLHMKDHGELIRKYRDVVAEKGVLLVKDIENVPTNLAMAFHYYCDEYDPLIKKSAIFFTLDLGNCSLYTGETSIHALLERCLSNKWKGLQSHNIGPLLTRVITCVVNISEGTF